MGMRQPASGRARQDTRGPDTVDCCLATRVAGLRGARAGLGAVGCRKTGLDQMRDGGGMERRGRGMDG